MGSSHGKSKWYLKPGPASPIILGPFSTSQLVDYLVAGATKNAYLSLNQKHWYPVGEIIPDSASEREAMESALTDFIHERLQGFKQVTFSVDKIPTEIHVIPSQPDTGNAIPKKYLIAASAAGVLLVLWGLVYLWHSLTSELAKQEHQSQAKPDVSQVSDSVSPPRASELSLANLPDPSTLTPKTPVSPPVHKAETTPKAPLNPIPVGPSGPTLPDKTLPPEHHPQTTLPPELVVAKPTSPLEKIPPNTSEQSHEPSKTDEPIKPTQEHEETSPKAKSLRDVILQYYRHLGIVANQAAKEYELRNAYQEFQQQAKSLNNFLQEQGFAKVETAKVDQLRLQNQSSDRYVFFYPAWLYEAYPTLITAVDPQQVAALERSITEQKQRLAPSIADNERLEQQKQRLVTEQNKVRQTTNNLDSSVTFKKQLLQGTQNKIQQIRSSIRSYQSDILRHRQTNRDLTQRISELHRRIRQEKDEKIREQLLQQEQTLVKEQNEALRLADNAQDSIYQLEEEFKTKEDEKDELAKVIAQFQQEWKDSKAQLQSLEQEQQTVVKAWTENNEKMQPLYILLQRQQLIATSVNKIQTWWRESTPAPKEKFLLASYVLQNFAPQYYRIRVKKWFGLGGIVEIHFW